MQSRRLPGFIAAFNALPANVQGRAIYWFWIGSHADYDRLLRNL